MKTIHTLFLVKQMKILLRLGLLLVVVVQILLAAIADRRHRITERVARVPMSTDRLTDPVLTGTTDTTAVIVQLHSPNRWHHSVIVQWFLLHDNQRRQTGSHVLSCTALLNLHRSSLERRCLRGSDAG